jgi:hypothetical protein
VSWAIVHSDDSWNDLSRLDTEERSSVEQTLLEWVSSGPPRDRSRDLAGLMLYEHHIENRIGITYFADDEQELVGLLRIRRLG